MRDSKSLSSKLKVKRKDQTIERDISRVICRLYIPGGNPARVKKIIHRIIQMDNSKTKTLLDNILKNFSERHKDIHKIFEQHFQQILEYIHKQDLPSLNQDQQVLIGAYFTMEYAIESAALFNPSIVPHPNQNELPDGSLRFIMSLRAVGEGHISSIVFRSGIINQTGDLRFEPASPYVDTPQLQLNPVYDRHLFQLKLHEMSNGNEITGHILEQLPEYFAYEKLKEQISHLSENPLFEEERQLESFRDMNRLASSNYQLNFQPDHLLSERVIFPVSEVEREGIEDARFVQFEDDGGEIIYYATYTAYNGRTIVPQLIETSDFEHFKISTLNGNAVQNKGMALFPRKIKGRYTMLARQDGENNHIMFSDHLHFWNQSEVIQEPSEPWEFVQIGNCGSPIETEHGWLVLTHGVGPVRTYSIGVILLDLDDPTRVISRLDKPLLKPLKKERVGYVPNVVYTCGSILHNGQLIIPYSMSDVQPAIASVGVEDLIDAMKPV